MAGKSNAVKYAAPIVFTAIIVFYEIAVITAVFVMDFSEKIPVWATVLIIVLPAIAAAGIIAALIMRIQEIKGGEEDAASKY